LETLGTYGTYPVMGRVSRFIHEHRRDFDPDFDGMNIGVIAAEKPENRHAGSIIPASNQSCYLKQELMCHPILWNLQP
jgi:hypothetical protein